MPLRTETVDLSEEREELVAEMEEQAQIQANHERGSDAAQQAAAEGQRAERFVHGLEWFVSEYDTDQLTFGALTNGNRHMVSDLVDMGYKSGDCYVAVGTADAPYCEHDADAKTLSTVESTVRNITDMHPAFVDWAEAEIHGLSHIGGETGNSYRELVREKRAQAASEEQSG